MDSVKEKILSEAETLFLKFGFKSITMDDVARELGISKKTLYLHFTDKNDLVNECVDDYLSRMNKNCQSITDQKEDAIGILLGITQYMSGMLKSVSQSSLYDLKKYFKTSWDKLEANRRLFIFNSIRQNLDLGIKKGLYRKDMQPDLVARIYVHLVSFLIDPESFDRNEMDLRELHLEIIKYHLHAVCTPKGQEVLQEKMKTFQKK
jgi:AcrR family transcriptional regulator